MICDHLDSISALMGQPVTDVWRPGTLGNTGDSFGAQLNNGVGKETVTSNHCLTTIKNMIDPTRYMVVFVKTEQPIPTNNQVTSTISYYPKSDYRGDSIIVALNRLGIDSCVENREKIAAKNGIHFYSRKPKQNDVLLNLLRAGKLIK